MAPAGLAVVESAHQSGTWNALDTVETLQEPPDSRSLSTANQTPDGTGMRSRAQPVAVLCARSMSLHRDLQEVLGPGFPSS